MVYTAALKCRERKKMSVRKYRLYLLMVTLVAAIAGAFAYFYYAQEEKSYKDGTLVQNVYVLEEEEIV